MPTITLPLKFIYPLFLVITLSIFLLGCGKEESSKKQFAVKQTLQKYKKDTTLKGKVRNKEGAIQSGEIKATDSKGKVVATTRLKNSNRYAITIPAGVELPLVLTYHPTSNSPGKEKLIAAVIYTAIKKYDINSLTTLIANKAKSLGGYSHTNMSIAADQTVGIPDANKTSTGFRGDPTKQYGGWH